MSGIRQYKEHLNFCQHCRTHSIFEPCETGKTLLQNAGTIDFDDVVTNEWPDALEQLPDKPPGEGDFAKLFAVDGTQVLVVLATSDDDYPQVKFTTKVDGLSIELAPTFAPPDKSAGFDEEKAWELAASYFHSIDQAAANRIHQQCVSMVRDGGD